MSIVSDFRCNDCETVFEQFHKPSDYEDKTIECPHCSSKNIEKIFLKMSISAYGGKDLYSRTPASFKELTKKIKQDVPVHALGNKLNII